MASNAFKATRKALLRANTHNEVIDIIDALDAKYQQDNLIMRPNDWPLLTRVISKVTRKLNKQR